MKILICAGGMPFAAATVRFGGLVAAETRAAVTLLHVISGDAAVRAGQQVLSAAREMLPDVPVDPILRQGSPTRRILAEARAGDHDLIVIGAHQGSPLVPRLAGSVARQVIRRAKASVLVVRGDRPQLGHLLICTGGSEVAEPVVEMGARLAGAARGRATLLHVATHVPSMYTGLSEIEETLPELLSSDTSVAQHLRHGAETLARHGVTAELELRHGVAADEILREAQEGDYDLIVIGASGATGRFRGWLLGNVTWQIIDQALRPVLVVKGDNTA